MPGGVARVRPHGRALCRLKSNLCPWKNGENGTGSPQYIGAHRRFDATPATLDVGRPRLFAILGFPYEKPFWNYV